jgi:Uma2 family endonuclease
MSTIQTAPRDAPRLHGLAEIWPLSLDDYHRMVETGIVGEDAPIEFIEGYLVGKDQGRGPGMGHGPAHALAVNSVNELLTLALAAMHAVRCQLPVTLRPDEALQKASEPEPDVVVAQGPKARYSDHHPGPAEIHLIVEVADSSLAYDRSAKARLYATAGVPLYWIVNLIDRRLEVYSDPDPATGTYRLEEFWTEDQQVVLVWEGLAPVTFQVRDFLP